MKSLATCLILGTVLMIGDAATARADFMTMGSGTGSCGSWTADRQPSGSGTAGGAGTFLKEQWVLGFLSGVGFVHERGDDPLRGMDVQGVLAWIDNYCRAHPIEPISTAAAAFKFAHPR